MSIEREIGPRGYDPYDATLGKPRQGDVVEWMEPLDGAVAYCYEDRVEVWTVGTKRYKAWQEAENRRYSRLLGSFYANGKPMPDYIVTGPAGDVHHYEPHVGPM